MVDTTTYRAAVRRLIDGLTEAQVCVHGPAFDSARWFAEEGYADACSVCRVVRPLVELVEEDR